jgi:HSP20 family protein
MGRLQSFRPFWRPLPESSAWSQLQQLQNEMNRLFGRWSGDGGQSAGLAAAFPAVNVWEDHDSVYIEAELPGVDQKDLELYVTGPNQFTIKGERKFKNPEKGIFHRQERGSGSFNRVLTLPFEVNRDKVEARLENGVLQIRLAKHESAKPRKISVKAE